MSGYRVCFFLPEGVDPSLKAVGEALSQFFARPAFETAAVHVLAGDWTVYVEVGNWELRVDVDTQPGVVDEAREFASHCKDVARRDRLSGATARWVVSTASDPDDRYYDWFAHAVDVIQGIQSEAVLVEPLVP